MSAAKKTSRSGAKASAKASTQKTARNKSKSAAPKKTSKKTTKKTTAKKTIAAKKPAKAPKKSTAKKSTAKKSTAKKATKKTPVRAGKKTVAKAPAPKKSAAKKSTAKKNTAKAPKKTTRARPASSGASKPPVTPKPAAKKAAATPSKPVTGKGPAATRTRAPRPAKLDAAALAAIREELLSELSDLEARSEELEKESERQTDLREAGVNEDFADAGTATFDRERDFSIRNNIRDLIDQITRALRRLDEGSYGSCERCGKPIDAARLKALPHALLCMDCKRREERAR